MLRSMVIGSFVMLAGCTALVEADVDSLGAQPRACSPGEVNMCPCAGGAMGTQLCTAGGSYDACLCDVPVPTPAAGAAGATAASSN